ncbi:WD repeat-containing protein 38 isoform X3 [Papio anubis]|uniref:WD repeat-containing protein 38 isoform X3 n=1 Tax=Papio anubis TaxID=9555 RepID=UPI0012ADA377|nr:WD repeat-containing protein 38 isoform X3 [Papio anubis]XP_031510365.1 WD repeat-containing protein 38 isoform X3 [Papio anubis]
MPCCRRESCPRVEAQRLAREVPSPSPPVSRLLRLHLLRAASGLALPVSPRGFAGTPPWPYAPPRLPWRRLVHSFPFPPPSPGVPRPPRWEPARSGRGRAPMNSGVPATLAVRRVKFFGRHGGEVNSSAFSPDGQMLLTGSEDGCVYGWETRSGQLLWRLGGHTGPVKFCRFSPDGHLFASASCDCTVRLWDVARAKCLQVLKVWPDAAPLSWAPRLRPEQRLLTHGELPGHRLLGLHHTHLGPADGDPSRLPPGARGTQWQHQLPVLLSIWPPGLRFLGQDHPHLEAHNQQSAYPTEGPRHLGEERSLLSRRAVAGQRRLFPHGQSLGLQHRKVP